MERCEKCLYYKSKEKCGECGRLSNAMDNNPMFTPNTNYDRIKSMSVEEMAGFFEEHFDCNFCPESERLADNPLLKGEKCDEKCTYHIKQWLLQEVSDE